MKRLLLFATALFFTVFAWAQYTTPTIDGSITSGEYGAHSEGQNQQTNGGQTWYMTWDASNLYIGITNANIGEGAVVYLDYTCLSPVNGGTNSEGTLVGQDYDGINFAELQFRADLVMYVKNNYREYRTANGSNGWSGATSGFGSYADNGGTNTREFSIPWSAIGGIPTCFNWFGYVTGSGSGAYGGVPTENTADPVPSVSRYDRYYAVSSTTNGSAVKPFSRNSYVFTGTANATGFGAISVYDFTMNNASYSITRGTGAWSIGGNLVVNSGVVNFGSTASGASVSGAVSIGAGGTLTLSTAVGGDLSIGGNFTQSGSFNCNNREVTFNGGSLQTLSGNFTGSNRFDYLRVAGSGLSLSAAVDIEDRLDFDAGLITVNNSNLTLYSGLSLMDADASRYVATVGSGYLVRNSVGNTSTVFPVGTATSYNPVTLINAGTADNYSVRVQSFFSYTPTNSTQSVQRQWIINEAVNGGSNLSIGLQWNANEEGNNFTRTGDLVIGRHNGSAYVETAAGLSGSNPYTASASGFTSLSPFAVGMLNALPVELSRFDAKVVGQSVWLSWATETEQNNAYFDVERSADGRNWSVIGTVNGQGTSFEPRQYHFRDDKPQARINYYRLKQVDFDGQWSYSPIVSVSFGNNLQLAVYPSPAQEEITINWGSELTNGECFFIVNAIGQVHATIKTQADQTLKNWNIAELPTGIYWLLLADAGGQIIAREKFVKTGG